MSKSKKLPYMAFYVGDLKRDINYKTLPPLAKLLWLEILFVMHDAELAGMLILNGKPMTEKQIAQATELDIRLVKQNLPIIKESQVCSITNDGIIFSRKMIERCKLSLLRSKAGSLGGNPNLLNQKADNLDKQTLDIENDNEIEVNKLILHGDFDTPEIRHALNLAEAKLKESGRPLTQTTLDAKCMSLRTPEELLKALIHTAGLSKTKNIYAPTQNGADPKKTTSEKILEMGAKLI